MQPRLMFVELKTDHSGNGPAWIGRVHFSKTGRTLYLNGKAYKMAHGVRGNYYEIESGDEYWISGIKKNGSDRLWFSPKAKTFVDREVVEEYLEFRGLRTLNSTRYEIIDFDHSIPKEKLFLLENEKL